MIKSRAECEDISEEYSKLDIFKKDQVIRLEGFDWTINTVFKGNRKRYDCITKMGGTVQHRMYDALELRQGKLL